jgi:hypothetical protein
MKRLFLATAIVLSFAARLSADEGFQCTQPPIVTNEAAGTIALEMMREGDLSQPAMARFSMQELMSPSNWDDIGSLTVPFPLGSNKATAQFPVNDSVYTGNRTLRAFCYGMLGTEVPWGTGDGTIHISILEEEPHPTISAESNLVIAEGDSQPVVITATPAFVRETTMNLSVFPISAGWNDFGVPPSIRFLANAGSSYIQIATYEDDLAESDETFSIEVWGAPGRLKTIQVTIVDDDHAPEPLSFDRESYEFAEGGTNQVTVTRGGSATQAAEATLHFDTDKVERWPADVPLHFAPGETAKTIALPFDDTVFSGNRITPLQIIAPNGFIADHAAVSMSDDDLMPVLSIQDTDVIEGNEKKKAELTLTLTAPLGVDLSLRVKTAHGTANASDYTPIDKEIVPSPALSRRSSASTSSATAQRKTTKRSASTSPTAAPRSPSSIATRPPSPFATTMTARSKSLRRNTASIA